MAADPDGRPPGTRPAGAPDADLPDADLPDATRRLNPAVPDADADEATERLHPVDEEALHWDGDDRTERLAPAGAAPVARPPRDRPAAASALLIVYGALGGVYLLMTIGWIATALRFTPTGADPLAAFMERVASVLAVASPAAWFVVAFWLTRKHPAWLRILWLVLGILLVAPWPIVTGSIR